MPDEGDVLSGFHTEINILQSIPSRRILARLFLGCCFAIFHRHMWMMGAMHVFAFLWRMTVEDIHLLFHFIVMHHRHRSGLAVGEGHIMEFHCTGDLRKCFRSGTMS